MSGTLGKNPYRPGAATAPLHLAGRDRPSAPLRSPRTSA